MKIHTVVESTPIYFYTIIGTASDGQTWTVKGYVQCIFSEAFNYAVKEAFQLLTQGKAQYGNPGKGCNGPYKVTQTLLVRKS